MPSLLPWSDCIDPLRQRLTPKSDEKSRDQEAEDCINRFSISYRGSFT